jgi:hypothetical protein
MIPEDLRSYPSDQGRAPCCRHSVDKRSPIAGGDLLRPGDAVTRVFADYWDGGQPLLQFRIRPDSRPLRIHGPAKLEQRIIRYEVSDFEWATIKTNASEQATRRAACERPAGPRRHFLVPVRCALA